jgi:hypothetical protein
MTLPVAAESLGKASTSIQRSVEAVMLPWDGNETVLPTNWMRDWPNLVASKV